MTTALQIASAVNAGTSARVAVTAALVKAKADTTNAIIRVHEARALAAADAVDARIKAGEQLPLAGVPIAIKDNLNLQGVEVTACSKILKGYIAPYTATAVERLEAAGAIVECAGVDTARDLLFFHAGLPRCACVRDDELAADNEAVDLQLLTAAG